MYQVKHFPLHNQVMQSIHDFLNTCFIIPPMNIQDINIVGPELLQACVDTEVERLDVVADVVDLLLNVILSTLIVGRILSMETRVSTMIDQCMVVYLRRNYELIPKASLFSPFTNEFL